MGRGRKGFFIQSFKKEHKKSLVEVKKSFFISGLESKLRNVDLPKDIVDKIIRMNPPEIENILLSN